MKTLLFAALFAPCALCAETVVDAAQFGFDPDAAPAVNAVALQTALDGGNKKVVVSRAGVYELDRTVYLDSDTTLEFAPGTVLKKMQNYCSVLINRGAMCYGCDSNIVVRNLEICVNGMQSIEGTESNAPGLRGHFAFYRVKNCACYNFTCNDCEGSQYCWQIAEFDGVVLDGFTIRGKKDGLHVNRGKNFVLRNGVLRTGDDGVALNAGDWPGSCTPVMGSIENGLIENVVDEDGGSCNFARVITGVWKQWHSGMLLQRDDIILAGMNVYAVHPLPVSTNEFVSLTMPTHTHGVWKSPEGINFQFLHADGCSRADIKNVVFRNITMQCARGFSCSWEMGEWARLVHPEINPADYPVCQIVLSNVVKTADGPIVGGNACADVTFIDCRAEKGPLASMGYVCSHGSTGTPYPTTRKFTVVNSGVGGGNADFALYDPNGTAEIYVDDDSCHVPVVSGSTPNVKVTLTNELYFRPPDGASENWSVVSNWVHADASPCTALPDASNILNFDAARALVNDVDGFAAGKMLFTATAGEYVLNGKPVTLAKDEVPLQHKTALTANVDLTFAASDGKTVQIASSGTATFNGAISVPNAVTLVVGQNGSDRGETIFNGGIDAEKATFRLVRGGDCRFYKPLRVANVTSDDYNSKDLHFHCTNNLVSGRTQLWYGRVQTHVADAFDEASVLGFLDLGYKEDHPSTAAWYFNGHDQVANRIVSKENVYRGNSNVWDDCDYLCSGNLSAAAPMTLTLKGTADARTWALLHGALSLVWAPKGDFTQTFHYRAHPTTGTLTVKGGCLQMADFCTFANVPAVTVEDGARFDAAVASTNALASLRKIRLGANARFIVGADAVSIFGAATPDVEMDATARFVLPAGTSLSVGAVYVDGAPLAVGTYAGGTASSLVEGAGTLVVTGTPPTCWTAANGGAWNDAANWSAGVPGANGGNVYLHGTYAIDAAAANLAQVGDFTMDVAQGAATLAIGAPMDFSGGIFTLGRNATVSVGAGGAFLWDGTGKAPSTDATTFAVGPEARFVSSGQTTLTNVTGTVALQGTLSVAGGTLDLHATGAGRVAIEKGGTLAASGDAVVNLHSKPTPPLYLDGGTVALSGSAAFHTGTGWNELFGGGTVTIADDAALCGDGNARVTFRPHAVYNRLTMTAVDRGRFAFTALNDAYFCGCNADSVLDVVFDSDATHDVGYCYVGHDVGYANWELRRGTVDCVNPRSGFMIGGRATEYCGTGGSSAAHGRVHVCGGTLKISGQEGGDSTFLGLLIGAGIVCTDGPRLGTGELLVSDGAVELARGPTLIGSGRNSGRLTLTGGTVVHNGTNALKTRPLLVGWANGCGELVVSNGTYETRQDVYVGGALTNALQWVGPLGGGVPDAYGLRHDATGVVTIACADATRPCSFTTEGDLIVGSDGVGSLVFGKAGGVMRVADAVFSNRTASAVSFVFDEKGVSRLAASGTVKVAPGAKLVVDVRRFPLKRAQTRLISASALEGRFAPEDVTLLSDRALDEIVQDEQGVWLARPVGAALIVR